jgi:hypothetical protein
MSDTTAPGNPPRKLWENLRAAAIVVLLGFLVYRVAFRPSPDSPPQTSAAQISIQQTLPRDLQDRLDAVGWRERVGDGLGLWVSVNSQRIVGIRSGVVQFIYPCSTAAKGVGNREGSNQTPLGWHELGERIGEGLPEGAVFNERKYTGRVWSGDTPTEKDFVLTRILWLRGLEPGVNQGRGVDSHDRYIYIHGTPAEDKIGTPASMGCIRMRNRDVVELFDRVPSRTPMLITEW